MKNKALTTFMATAITATMVLPMPIASAEFSDSSVKQSHYNEIHTSERTAKSTILTGESITISNVTADTVRTSIGQLKVTASLKPIFKAANRSALMNAQATVVVKNGEITSVTSLTLKKAGTNKKEMLFDGGDAHIEGNLTVDADYIKVQNVNISDELIVTNRVKKAISIDKVAIGDKITFKPLAIRKIDWLNASFKNVEASNINVQRNKLKLVSEQPISTVDVTDKVTTLEIMADVKKVVINVDNNFSLYGEGKIEQIVVKKGAKVSLDSAHQVNNVQVDDNKASVTLPSANKTALSKLVASPPYVAVSIYGTEISSSEKWTTQAERNVFETAVNSARAVANDTKASQEQVNNSIAQYNNALANYQAIQKYGKKYTTGDKSTLSSLIQSVQYVTVSWNYGNDVSYNAPWTTQSEKDTLASAVSSAQSVVNNYNATQYEITNAINYLNNAISTYKNAYKYGTNGYNGDKSTLSSLIYSVQYVTVSWNNGNDVSYNSPWTTQNEKDALASAVSSAQSVVNNYNATQYEITNAISYLNNAISTYKNAYKYGTNGYNGDKSTLNSIILSVSYERVSYDGTDVYYNTRWTTQSEKDALVSAVSSAQSVANNSNATQYEITNAISNLNNAIAIYMSAYKYGTRQF